MWLTALTLFASSSAAAVATADEEAPKRAPPPCREVEPARWERVDQPNTPLVVIGTTTLWFTYFPSLAGGITAGFSSPYTHALARSPSGAKVSSSAIGVLALPVAGPFIADATVPKMSPNGPIDDRAFRATMIVDGSLQVASVGMLVASGMLSKPKLVKVPPRHRPGDPCEGRDAPDAKRGVKQAQDDRLVPILVGALFIAVFHPIAEIVAVTQSRDRARLWAVIPGPGPIIAAATLNPSAIHTTPAEHPRVGYAILGGTEMAALGLMATAPLWKNAPTAALPEVKVGAGSAALTWKF